MSLERVCRPALLPLGLILLTFVHLSVWSSSKSIGFAATRPVYPTLSTRKSWLVPAGKTFRKSQEASAASGSVSKQRPWWTVATNSTSQTDVTASELAGEPALRRSVSLTSQTRLLARRSTDELQGKQQGGVSFIRDLIRMIRPEFWTTPAFMIMGHSFEMRGCGDLELMYRMLIGLYVHALVHIYNDLFDFEADCISKQQGTMARLLATIPRDNIFELAIIMTAALPLLSSFMAPGTQFLFAAALALMTQYSGRPFRFEYRYCGELFGSVWLAFLMPMQGASVSIFRSHFYQILSVFFCAFARSAILQIPDIKPDLFARKYTLQTLIGAKGTLTIATFFWILMWVFDRPRSLILLIPNILFQLYYVFHLYSHGANNKAYIRVMPGIEWHYGWLPNFITLVWVLSKLEAFRAPYLFGALVPILLNFAPKSLLYPKSRVQRKQKKLIPMGS